MTPTQKHHLTVFLFVFLISGFHITNSRAEGIMDIELPAWLQRVDFDVQLETDKKPIFYMQTVQPLYQDADQIHTVFVQPRINIRNERAIYNLGFGYRHLKSEDLILGINLFGDYEDEHRHTRAGVGLEALGQVLEFRANSYIGGLSNKVNVNQGASLATIERVASGFDYEIGSPIPYVPWLKVFGSGFHYDFEKRGDLEGWKTRVEATLNENMKFEFFTKHSNLTDDEHGGRLRFVIPFGNISDILAGIRFSEEKFERRDLREILLVPVEREFTIIVEQSQETTGLTVNGGRT